MLCKVCCEGLQGIWDPSKTKRVCRTDEFGLEPMPESVFATVETYTHVEPYDPEFHRPEHYMFGHHLTKESFEQSVRDGCVMCRAFGLVPRQGDEEPDPKITALGYYSLFSVDFEDCPFMYLYVCNSRGGFALSPHFAEHENLNLRISPSTGDDATWAIIQAWLDTCLQTHDRCNERPSSTFVPTRLLRLEIDGTEPFFRIVSSSEVEPGSRYVTLSHCCNLEDDDLRLSKSNLAQLSAAQPLSVLPATFCDAFTVVARLGLTHLWIDRFCILQDDLSEQRSAAVQARDVFRNAFLSIAATGAASSSSGLFFARDPAHVAPTLFDFPVDVAGTTVPHFSSLEARAWADAFLHEPLVKSARAVPERLLAPRVVHFGRKMVFWECCGASCAEVHPRGVSKPVGISNGIAGPNEIEDGEERPERTRPWKALLNAYNRWGPEDPAGQVFSGWFAILTMYSGCVPTTPSDKLPTLAGQVQEMKTLLRQQGFEETGYYAGLWKAMLPAGLLWNTNGTGSRPAAYRAPSWSWAAIDGRVNFHDSAPNDDGLLCKLLRVSTTPRTEDETGEIAAGSIVLRGKLALGRLDIQTRSHHLDQRVRIKTLVDPAEGTLLGDAAACEPSEYSFEWRVVFDSREDIKDEILCFPIRSMPSRSLGYALDGLALFRRSDGPYVRCGKWGLLTKSEEEALGVFQELPEQEVEIV